MLNFILSFSLGVFSAMAAFLPANRPIDVSHYRIKFAVNPAEDPSKFDAEVTITLKALTDLQKFTLDMKELKIHEVKLLRPSVRSISFQPKDNLLEITLPGILPKGEQTSLAVSYTGTIQTDQSGFFKVRDPDEPSRGPLFFTQFEALEARSFFPSNDEPYDKATTEIEVSVPAAYEVISNGRNSGERKFKKGKDDWREITWTMDKPHSTYLVSVAIGPFAKLTEPNESTEVSIWVGKTKVDKAKYAARVTSQMIRFFENYLGVKYPWPKYATVGLPTFLWGGMENTSCTFMNEERTLLNDPSSEFEKKRIVGLAAHELAHQWFGDLVTMKWWDDLWLNEAFASHLGTLATKHIFQNEEIDLELVTDTWDDYFREEAGPRSHPIVNKALSSADDAFDATNYTKGENVLRMLSLYVGEEHFRKGLQSYLHQYAYSNATYLSFFDAVEKVSGKKLSSFRDSWLLQRGYPVLTFGGKWQKKTSSFELKLSQQANHPKDKSIFTFRVPIVFHRKTTPTYSHPIFLEMNRKTHTVRVPLLEAPEWITVNPQGVVLAKVVPQKKDEMVLASQALQDPEPLARVWASYELASGVLQGGKISAVAEKTLTTMLTTDTSPYVRISLLSAFQKMKSRWLPELIATALFESSQKALERDYPRSPLFISDPHGWAEFRSESLGTLGKVNNKEVLPFLSKALANPLLPLDDVSKAALSVASVGDIQSAALLKSALKIHEKRGYRYAYWIRYAFGALESPLAANEIREIALSQGPDLLGRIGWLVRDNHTLKNSKEWTDFLKDFILKDEKFGEEVKARILHTVEEVKNGHVKSLLETLAQQSDSERIKEASRKILKKNFL